MIYPLREAIEDFTSLGGLALYLLLALLHFLMGYNTVGYALLSSLIMLYVIIIVIRLFYYRNRPVKREYHNIVERIDASSFPSMHSARASSLAIILGSTAIIHVAIILWIVAVGVGIARIILKKHDIIDVIAGLLLGAIIGYASIILFGVNMVMII